MWFVFVASDRNFGPLFSLAFTLLSSVSLCAFVVRGSAGISQNNIRMVSIAAEHGYHSLLTYSPSRRVLFCPSPPLCPVGLLSLNLRCKRRIGGGTGGPLRGRPAVRG